MENAVAAFPQPGAYVEHHIRLALRKLGDMLWKLREISVYVLSAHCMYRFVVPSMEQSDLMASFNQPLHHEWANESCSPQHENPTHMTSVLRGRAPWPLAPRLREASITCAPPRGTFPPAGPQRRFSRHERDHVSEPSASINVVSEQAGKYARLELERRFLVGRLPEGTLGNRGWRISDRY